MTFGARWGMLVGAAAVAGMMTFVTACESGGSSSGSTGSSSSGSSGGSSSGDTDGGPGSGEGGGGGGGGGPGPGADRTTYSCDQTGRFCVEYTGSPTNIDTIRASSQCVEQGGVEGAGCPRAGVTGVCNLPANGSTGTSGAQYYYAVDEDLLNSVKSACENRGGTFTKP